MERAPAHSEGPRPSGDAGRFRVARDGGRHDRSVLKALPLVHPEFPGIDVPGVVTVVVAPEIAGTVEEQILVPAPRPVESLLRTICNYLDLRRMLTTELVVGPVYIPVELRLVAVVSPGADAAEAASTLTAAMRKFLHPIHGGNDGKG